MTRQVKYDQNDSGCADSKGEKKYAQDLTCDAT